VNKPVNLYYFYSCIRIFFYFYIFSIFILFYTFLYFLLFFLLFLLILGLGPAQPTWAGLSPADPAGPSQQEARVDWLHMCIMHSAKVINLPSHRATSHSKLMYKNESKWLTCSLETVEMVAARCPSSAHNLPSCFSFASVPAVPFLFLFFLAFSVLAMKHWGWCWLLLSNLGMGFVLCFLCFFLCVFFLCFAGFLPSVLLSFSPCLAPFFSSPARSPLLCFYRTSGSPRW